MESPLEPVLTPEAYRFVVDLVYQHSRIRLGDDKQALLANRLRHRLKDLAISSYKKYCQILESVAGPEEIEHLVDLISTNHTKFFRELSISRSSRKKPFPRFSLAYLRTGLL